MMFVRCRGGISHHPDEAITMEDLSAAIAATARFIQQWSSKEPAYG
jgi:allantoate deiminase